MNRRKTILVILLVLFGLSVGYGYITMPRQKRVDRLTYSPGVTAKPMSTGISTVDENKLHLELLGNEQHRFSGFRRNIFKPIFHDDTKTVGIGLPLPSGKQVLPIPPSNPLTTVNVQLPEPPLYVKDMGRFTFLGFLKKDNRKTIFLSSDKEIFLVHKGDKIYGRYEVLNITDEALTISVLADGSEIVIPLVENKTLAASRR